ncbi:MAG: shikimate dehydrogenase [Ruminococcus sp.]|nr:shikimate dehydrogenase [Ruminococcus sp.]
MEKYTLIGHPLGHSMSPLIHEKLFELRGKAQNYDLTDIAPEDLSSMEDKFRAIKGFNVTIPHKVNIIPQLDEMADSAKRYNSVNCVDNKDGRLIGYNTDCDGFLLSVKDMPLGGKVLLVGCGGVGRMIAVEAVRHGADLTIAHIPEAQAQAEALCNEIRDSYPEAKLTAVLAGDISGSFDMLINASPVGMYPKTDACPVSDEVINNCGCAFDVVYNPVETVLVKKFRALGKRAVGGVAMLVYQAVKAHEIWDGDFYSAEEINSVIKAVEDRVNADFA